VAGPPDVVEAAPASLTRSSVGRTVRGTQMDTLYFSFGHPA